MFKIIWLVVWNINFIFPYIGFLIIPIDELIFFRGVKPPTSYSRLKQCWSKHMSMRFPPRFSIELCLSQVNPPKSTSWVTSPRSLHGGSHGKGRRPRGAKYWGWVGGMQPGILCDTMWYVDLCCYMLLFLLAFWYVLFIREMIF